jgi:hypothetical protein
MFLHDWKDGGLDEMVTDFGIDKSVVEDCEILLASYSYEDYEGDAFVLFKRDGKLFEVNGCHCSCHGLESQSYSGDTDTQWEPEETTKEALEHRLENSTSYSGNEYAAELKQVLLAC